MSGIELGAAYVSILPETRQIAPKIRNALRDAEANAASGGGKSGSTWGSTFAGFAGRTLKAGLAGAIVGGSLLGGAGLRTAAELEQSKIGFTTMLGSAKAADAMMQQIKRTANNTPFELKGLTQSSQKLLAFGFQAKDVIPTLTTLGDAASGLGLGQSGLDQITNAVGQIQAKGKLQGDELMQLSEAGVPALRILSNEFGVSTTKMQQMISSGLVPANQAIPNS